MRTSRFKNRLTMLPRRQWKCLPFASDQCDSARTQFLPEGVQSHSAPNRCCPLLQVQALVCAPAACGSGGVVLSPFLEHHFAVWPPDLSRQRFRNISPTMLQIWGEVIQKRRVTSPLEYQCIREWLTIDVAGQIWPRF